MSRLFVGDLPFKATEHTLRDIFSEYGKLIDTEIIRDRLTRSSRGFGFVTFESAEEAKLALDNLNGTEVMGRKMKIEIAVLRTERPLPPPTKAFAELQLDSQLV